VTEKQEENKKMSNNEEIKNSFKVKKSESDYHIVKESNYHITDSNVNFYNIEDYNQKEKNDESDINFVTISMFYCCNYHQSFDSKISLF